MKVRQAEEIMPDEATHVVALCRRVRSPPLASRRGSGICLVSSPLCPKALPRLRQTHANHHLHAGAPATQEK